MTEPLQAVVTTGIYCRASCSARPAARNVRPVSSPVAAEAAGYRPCLKCRSDRVHADPNVESTEVTRAMAMISDGYLDRHTEAELAHAVGYSARQLRRLFELHVGATPDFVARSRRAHFARRMLDETNLTVTEIAYASGFNSLRQMNRVVKDIFAFTPTELRAKRRRNQSSATDGGLTLTIEAPPSAPDIISYLAPRSIPGVEQVVDDRYLRTIVSCGHPGVIEVAANDEGALEITAHLPTFASLVDDIAAIKKVFGVVPDLAADRHLEHDPILRDLVRRRPGLRMPGAWDPFEIAVRIVIGQHISVPGATTITGRLVERLGSPIEATVSPGLTHTFPTPGAVAGGDLSGLGLTRKREETLRSLSGRVETGWFDSLSGLSLQDLTGELEALPGIGPWTSNLIAARAFGHRDAFPASDLGLRKAGAVLTGRSTTLNVREMTRLAEDWRPYRATAAAHLWFSGGA
ncbi:MAG: helix-turn-helix domain-containing protein [Acidimicrobiia bacterium]|nr:helix-turn-helix domain-containing protein [Acidimicrobiia bacterium]